MKIDRENWQDILALVPRYDELGNNGTEIWLTGDRIVYDTRKLDTVLKELAGVFAVDIVQLKRNCRSELGRARNIPLVLQQELWLMPVVCRQAQSRHDGARGYLVYQQVAAFGSDRGRTVVRFRGHTGQLVLPQQETSVRWIKMLTEMIGEKAAAFGGRLA